MKKDEIKGMSDERLAKVIEDYQATHEISIFARHVQASRWQHQQLVKLEALQLDVAEIKRPITSSEWKLCVTWFALAALIVSVIALCFQLLDRQKASPQNIDVDAANGTKLELPGRTPALPKAPSAVQSLELKKAPLEKDSQQPAQSTSAKPETPIESTPH